MAIPLKDYYDQNYIQNLANKVKSEYNDFKEKNFVKAVLSSEWKNLELKERMHKITSSLHDFLPKDFQKAIEILIPVAPHFGGYHGILFPLYIELYGQEHWALSIDALEKLTPFSSSEFAVRPFLQKHPEEMMKVMLKWSKHKNEHVRRLASEGCRPRLPWGMALYNFKKDPSLILPILENLKNDPSEYVRRSVANNLNDISKDNPDVLLKIASKWHGINSNTDRLLKHAMRSMLKKGNPKALKIFGLGNLENISNSPLKIESSKIKQGTQLHFSFTIEIKNQESKMVRVEYVLYFCKKNDTHTRKVFKLAESYVNGKKHFQKKHSFADLSTRKHHPGLHYLALQINGIEQKKIQFHLLPNH